MRADFAIVSVTPESVIIRDLDGLSSVTNDAEAVIQSLYESGFIKGPGPKGARTVYYYDSEDKMDRLCHDGNGHFTGFKFGMEDAKPEPGRNIIV